MIYIIGISYSVEYAVKGIYREYHRPRLRMDQGRQATPQDEYARAVLQDYAAFLYTVPGTNIVREKLDGLMRSRSRTPSSCAAGARLRAWRGIFPQDRLCRADPEGARRRWTMTSRATSFSWSPRAAEVLAKSPHQADPRARRPMAAGAGAALQGVH
jgi:hypothetical protein